MDLIGFSLAILLIELTPGPNMAWLAGLSATQGRQSGYAAVAGIALGLLNNGMLAALGLAALLTAAPELWNGLRLAGAAMMFWLAIETWRDKGGDQAALAAKARSRRAFNTGLLINLLNPKAYVFFVVVAPQFLNGQPLALGSAFVLALVSTAIATVIHLAIVMIGSKAQHWVSDPVRTRWVRRVFAVVMLAVGASFLFAHFE